ncbi:DUF4276 family protein [Actinomyces dentalis]|jgi:hypothetical protein|uniref:DUF4276 family protein n=1 Tax=Actinomyces dentalis TaxID=272548 RepID=UPI002356318B|nr:DUF4276 family protein [Actinomyces dentalis]
MRQVCILVEGQTEEAVVKTLLIDAAKARDIYLIPIIMRTSLTPAGASRGGGSWKHYDRQLNDLLSQSHWDLVGLIIDYYGYPSGAPGFELPEAPGDQRQQQIVAALKEHYPDPRFHPLVVLHEIKSLVLSAIRAGGGRGLLSEKTIEHLIRAIDDAGGPEKINNGEKTSPSKRLLTLEPEYGKTSTGISILREVGLAAVLDRCPVFAAWWRTLLSR